VAAGAGDVSFRLPFGIKPQVDNLGPGYVNIMPAVMNGTPVFEHSGKLAKQRFFEKGLGFPRLGNDDCEIRIWPGIDKIAVCWGHVTRAGEPWYVAHVYGFDLKIREQLEAKGLIPRIQ
jgi:hypothetical protein